MDKNKKWFFVFLIEFVLLLVGVVSLTIFVDPLFHYHKPLSILQYPLNNERYQNDGIVKNFTYNAIITGTSMTQNFKSSEMDELFQVKSVKVPFSGGSLKEINQNLERAIKHNDKIQYIVRGVDFNYLMQDKDTMRYELSTYPTYLYNDSLFDDTRYFLNKDVLFKNTLGVISYTKKGSKTTSFDQYSNWNNQYVFGKESVEKEYKRLAKKQKNEPLTIDERNTVIENVKQNLLQIAKDNPQIQFYYFYTPYSIYYWDDVNNQGILLKKIEAEKIATEMMLDVDNIHLYSFWNNVEMISNLDNYKDIAHYGEWINSDILKWMKNGDYLLSKLNYESYYKNIEKIYVNYNYEALFVDSIKQ